jgi:hypothetical protein
MCSSLVLLNTCMSSKKYHDKFFDVDRVNLIHKGLKCCWGIREAKGHD